MSRCYCQLTEQEGGPPNERWLFRPAECSRCGRVTFPDQWTAEQREAWEGKQ